MNGEPEWVGFFFCEVAVRERGEIGGADRSRCCWMGGCGRCETGEMGPVGVGAWVCGFMGSHARRGSCGDGR
jgi:hypothetical protein